MRTWKYIFGFLVVLIFLTIISVFQVANPNLKIIVCDVGQGDAILVVYKNIEILTDGGPDNRVMDCLGKYMPYFDRQIELVILTHPQSDHYGGLVEVFRRYEVDNFLYNDILVSSQSYELLINEVGSSGARLLNPDTPMVIRLGLISLDIVNPAKGFTGAQTNDYSITDVLTFGNFKAVFTGDMSPRISERLSKNWNKGSIDYIKIPHHGSKVGVTENFLKAIEPKVAVISVGAKNSYGHPSPEILDMLSKLNIPFYRTDEMGDVVIETDGESSWRVK